MSLLMEALRKAEEAKRKVQHVRVDSVASDPSQPGNTAPISPLPVIAAAVEHTFVLETHAEDPAADSSAADVVTEQSIATRLADKYEGAPGSAAAKPSRASIEELQNYLQASPEIEEATLTPRSDSAAATGTAAAQQRAAAAVFAAKQKSARSHTTRNLAAVMLIAICTVIAWYLLNTSSPSLMLDPALLNVDIANRNLSDEQMLSAPESPNAGLTQALPLPGQTPAAPTETATLTPATAEYQQTPVSEPAAVAEIAPPPAPAAPVVPALPATVSAQVQAPATQPSSVPVGTDAALISTSPAAAASAGVLEVSHNAGSNRNNQQLLNAYTSLQAGDLAAAAPLYRQVLEQLPNNRDALLGSASIALRQGRITEARDFYSRLMQLNPQDPLARTGLLQTIQDIDQRQYEQELQRLLQQFPDVAPLSFALGNVYAGQQRWHEAQSAYFDALLFARQNAATAISPDYAYNLAVSLEQINQPQAALGYYKQAEIFARDITPGFDRLELSRRLSFLESNTP